jgi:hypothetical protein
MKHENEFQAVDVEYTGPSFWDAVTLVAAGWIFGIATAIFFDMLVVTHV